MRKSLLSLFLALGVTAAFAQTTPATPAAPKENAKPALKVESAIYKKLDYFHLELTHSNWMNRPDSLKIKPLSRGVNVFLAYPMPLGKSNFTFTIGAGISAENIYYNGAIKKDSSGNSYFSPITQSYKTNKLATVYAIAPLTLGFKTKPDKFNHSFKCNLGLRLGYNLNTHTKYKGNDASGTAVKYKNLLLPNINKFRYEANFTFGYDWFYLVANYSLSTYFTDGKGVAFHPFSIGLGVVGF